jgi:molecular chaperone DnaK
MMKDAESHSADDARKRDEIEARNRLDGLVYQMEKTLSDNRDKVGAVASDVRVGNR